MAFSDAKQCKAKAKGSGERCKNPAMEGKEVCRIHGGLAGRPPIHGRYSVTKRQSLQNKINDFYNDPSSGDLRSELALLRALLQERLDQIVVKRTISGTDINQVYSMVDNIGRLVERIAKILATTALTQAELQLLQVTMIDALNEFIPDADQQRRFISRVFGSLRSGIGSSARAIVAEPTDAGVAE